MRFQSVGSQYSFNDSFAHLLARNNEHHSSELIAELERQFEGKAYLYANGRSALAAALQPLAKNGDAVAINGFTCYVVQEAVKTVGAVPVFLDVELATLNFPATQLETALQTHPNLRAVVIQNTFGIACDIGAIESFARAHQLIIIEDLAHCVGLTYPDGRKAGTVGDIVMLSFGRDKLLDCVSGGALIVRTSALQTAVAAPIQLPARSTQHRDRWYPTLMWLARTLYPIGIGKVLMKLYQATKLVVRTADGSIDTQVTMPSWQAGRVLIKLKALPSDVLRRQKLGDIYHDHFPAILHESGAPVRIPHVVKNRSRVFEALRHKGYYLDDTWYDTPIGPARLYGKVSYPEESCPNAVAMARQIINLPTHQAMTSTDAERIARIIQEVERESA